MEIDLEQRQYPLGRFKSPKEIDKSMREGYMQIIRDFPPKLADYARGMATDKLDRSYREGGWTGRQLIHHVADSHMNACIRFRLALTEAHPTIKAYNEAHWAELRDARHDEIDSSLNILTGLHHRWFILMQGMSDADWKKTFYHPQYDRISTLESTAALYAWHSMHHFAQLKLVE